MNNFTNGSTLCCGTGPKYIKKLKQVLRSKLHAENNISK